MQDTHPTVLAGSLWFNTRDLMESFSQQLEKDKSSYFDRLRRFLEDAGVDQHGKDTEIICMRALSLAETAQEELMQKLPLCTVYDSNKINTTSSTDDRYAEEGGGYQACMKMLHDMHVRLHAAMLQQTSERVHQKDELHGLCTDAALVAQEFSVCLIDHMQEALLALLAQKKHQVQTWQSTIVRLCYKEMNACDTIIENKISKAYDIGGAMEHAIRQGIQDRLQLEQDVISAVSNEINQRTEQTKTRLAAIKTMRKEIYEKQCSVRRHEKDVKREEHVLQKMRRSQKNHKNQICANQECMVEAQNRIQARHDKAASFLQKMSDKKRLLKQSDRHVQARNKLVQYKISCFKVLHARLLTALMTMHRRATPGTEACLEFMNTSLDDLSTYLKRPSVNPNDVGTGNQIPKWSTASFWESIGDLAVPSHVRGFLREQQQAPTPKH